MKRENTLGRGIGRGVLLALLYLSAQNAYSDINLLTDPDVYYFGSYTYYARGYVSGSSNVDTTPFTTIFYPGYSATTTASHGGTNFNLNEGYPTTVDTNTTAYQIAFSGFDTGSGTATGKLFDGSTSNSVSGWVGVVSSTGYFDILINLGSIQQVSSIIINYTDSSGRRWNTSALQYVYTATAVSSTPQDSDFTLYSSGTFTKDASAANYTFSNGTVSAQYIDLRLAVSVGTSASGGSYGGVINEIYIMGIPEPSTYALLGVGGVVLGGVWVSKRKKVTA